MLATFTPEVRYKFMLTRWILLAALLLIVPSGAAAQRREPPLPRFAPPTLAPETSPDPPRALTGMRAAGPVRHAFVGALAGAAAGFGAYLILEETTPHTDHSDDALVRFAAVTTGAAVGVVAGVVLYAVRNR